MTDEIKGLKSPQPQASSNENGEPRPRSAEGFPDPYAEEDAAVVVGTVETGVRGAAEEVRRVGAALDQGASNSSPRGADPASRAPSEVPASPPPAEAVSTPAASSADSPRVAEPVRSPEVATELANKVAADIRSNPQEAMAVNVRAEVVRALFT